MNISQRYRARSVVTTGQDILVQSYITGSVFDDLTIDYILEAGSLFNTIDVSKISMRGTLQYDEVEYEQVMRLASGSKVEFTIKTSRKMYDDIVFDDNILIITLESSRKSVVIYTYQVKRDMMYSYINDRFSTNHIILLGHNDSCKSSFVNTYMSMMDGMVRPYVSIRSHASTTRSIQGYIHHKMPKITIWDTPGFDDSGFSISSVIDLVLSLIRQGSHVVILYTISTDYILDDAPKSDTYATIRSELSEYDIRFTSIVTKLDIVIPDIIDKSHHEVVSQREYSDMISKSIAVTKVDRWDVSYVLNFCGVFSSYNCVILTSMLNYLISSLRA